MKAPRPIPMMTTMQIDVVFHARQLRKTSFITIDAERMISYSIETACLGLCILGRNVHTTCVGKKKINYFHL